MSPPVNLSQLLHCFWQIEYSLLCQSLVPWFTDEYLYFMYLESWVAVFDIQCPLVDYTIRRLRSYMEMDPKLPKVPSKARHVDKFIRNFINLSSRGSSHDPNQYYREQNYKIWGSVSVWPQSFDISDSSKSRKWTHILMDHNLDFKS